MARKSLLALLLLVFPVAVLASPPAADNAKMLRTFYESLNQGKVDVIDQMLAPSFVEHEPLPGFQPNRDGVKKWFQAMRTAFPDLRFDVHFMMVDGDKVAAYATLSGTQAAEFMGVPSQGKEFSVHGVDIIRFADGKAVEHWGAFDTGAMMDQLTGGGPMAPAAPK